MGIVRASLSLLIGVFMFGHASAAEPRLTPPRSMVSLDRPGAAPIAIDALYTTRRTGGPAWSPDGRRVVFTTDITGRANLWEVDTDGGWPMQLSVSNDREYFPAWSPDGKWIVYQSDHGGDEMWDLYAVPADGGPVVNLTHSANVAESDATWSPDGKSLLVVVRRKGVPGRNLAVLDWKTRRLRRLTHGKAGHLWNPAAWSPHGRYVYASRINTQYTDGNVYRIDVASGVLRQLTHHRGEALEMATSLSPDGKTLLLDSNAGNGKDAVMLLDIASGRLRRVAHADWDTEAGTFSPDGRLFDEIVNADGQVATYVVDRATLKARKVDLPTGLAFPAGSATAFSPDGKRMLVSFENAQRPSDLWVYDIATHRARQLTHSGIASLRPADIPPARLVHYRSFDGTLISAYVWMLYNLKRDGSHPAVVLPHGGPAGQSIDDFRPLAAALASRGYVCIAPNVRGSSGYGAAFQKANYQDLGGGDLKDEIYAVHFLIGTGYVDPHRIGITGASYGGFMTLMAIGKTPDVWAAAVSRYGMIDWLSMLKGKGSPSDAYERSLLGDPVKHRQVYINDSPITYIAHAKAPLLVLQGDNDARVPKQQAQEVVKILRQHGRIVQAHFYAHEGHGFVRREDRIDATRRIVAWFDRYLKGARKKTQ